MTLKVERSSRVMPPNNIKQAMLPATAEVLDNPVGTACGFVVTIGKARFMFTPGVPRELRRMLEDQIIPRLLAKSGKQSAIYLKRFHSYGIGESHADTLLADVESLAPEGSVKLGFRVHYPLLETKLTVRGADMEAIRRTLAPVEAEVRKPFRQFASAIHLASRCRARASRSSPMLPMLPTSKEASSTARRDSRNTLGAFRPLAAKSTSAGVSTSSKPASAWSIFEDTMHTSQSSKREACRSIKTGRSLAPERSV